MAAPNSCRACEHKGTDCDVGCVSYWYCCWHPNFASADSEPPTLNEDMKPIKACPLNKEEE
jgi:hypothetical protein